MQCSRMGSAGRAGVLLLMILCGTTVLYAQEAPATPAAPPPAAGPVYKLSFQAGLSTFDITNSHFGRGLVWPLPTQQYPIDTYKSDVARTELFVAPRLDMTWQRTNGTIFGAFRPVFTSTTGDGDTWNVTSGNPSHTDIDTLFVGWRSKFGQTAYEVTVGNQDYQLGDGMVLIDGDQEASNKGSYWSDPRKAWERAVIAKLDRSKMHVELFSLNTDRDFYNDAEGQPFGGNFGDSIRGLNVEYRNPALGVLGASHFRVNSSDFAPRDGMRVSGVHARVRPVKTKPTLEFGGEYNLQKNPGRNIEANAWFADVKYTVLRPWYPTFGYRYASFSGDDASTTNSNEAWDELHNGYNPVLGPGYWWQGLVIGTYETLLTNINSHFFHVTVAPPKLPGSWIKMQYWDFRFDEPSTAGMFPHRGAAVTSDKFATEWDLILGYTASPRFTIMAGYGMASPGEGGKQRNEGFDSNEPVMQLNFFVHF